MVSGGQGGVAGQAPAYSLVAAVGAGQGVAVALFPIESFLTDLELFNIHFDHFGSFIGLFFSRPTPIGGP